MQRPTQLVPSPVRLPPELKEWLKHQAINNKRSMNSEVIFRLEVSRKQDTKGQQQ